ncbi:unnamed protein product, partial [Nippostrongylus brasiliensis]|uniref:SWIM-type domain-containing protein n=1 Tax=Nippostrongylus brasiliensis TaxID=27835 RepID=A0A0N4XYP5_NIPBR
KFSCNRAAAIKRPPTATDRVRGSKKDVQYCTCHLVVRIHADGKVNVEGCSGHAGHEPDPALLLLSAQQNFYLRALLEEYSMDYIIKKLRKEDPTRSTNLSFVVEKDLTNILAQFNMRPGWRHDDDVASVQLRCEENDPDDGTRVFEPPQNPNGAGFLMGIYDLRVSMILIYAST